MGFIASLRSKNTVAEARQAGVDRWRDVFGSSAKEDRPKPPAARYTNTNEGWARTLVGADPAQKRLLQAFRTNAPGGWPDDRFEQTKHWEGVPYIAMHRKCMQFSQAEFGVFVRDDNHPDGKRPVKRGEPGYDLNGLLEKPNKKDSFGMMMYRWGQQMDLTGEALSWMIPNVLGDRIVELYVIPTAMAIPQPAINPEYPEGYYRIMPYYPYGPFSTYPTPTTSVGAPIPAQWMMQFQYPHPLLRYAGFSPMTAGRLQIDELNSMDRSRWYSQLRQLRPAAVVETSEMEDAQPWNETEINRVKADFEALLQGPENAGALLFPPPGGKITPYGTSPAEMDWPQSWSQMADFAITLYGMTKAACGMESAGSYAQYFAALKQLHLMTLKPDCDLYAAMITRRIAPYFGEDLIVEIRCPKIDDHEVALAKAQLLSDVSAITYNQLLKMLDQPTTDEPWGEERVGQQQAAAGMGMPGAPAPPPLGQNGATGEPPPSPPELERGRPTPGKLNQGSLGPRKHLNGHAKKVLVANNWRR